MSVAGDGCNGSKGCVGDPRFDITELDDLRSHIGKPAEVSEKRLKFTPELTETQLEFIKRSPFCMLGTVDEAGMPSVSPKGDAPGFVQVVSPKMLLIPERPGNKLIFSLQNVLRHPEVQILFIVPNTCETLRVSGLASLSRDPALCEACAAGGEAALLVIRVQVTECYYHCAKAFIRSQLWKPERWPAGRFNVRLGQIMANKAGKDAAWVEEYERGASERLQAVASHYEGRVWAAAEGELSPSIAHTISEQGKRMGWLSFALVMACSAALILPLRAANRQR